jgi:hypothetical protein
VGDADIGDAVGRQAVRPRRLEDEGVRPVGRPAGDRRQADVRLGRGARVEMRRVVLEGAVEGEDDVLGGHHLAVVEAHALPQGEEPALRIVRVDPPGDGEAGPQRRRLVVLREVPRHELVVDRDAHEAVALAALVRDTVRHRHRRGGHADAQGRVRPALRQRQVPGQRRRGRQGAGAAEHPAAIDPSRHRTSPRSSGGRRLPEPCCTRWSGGDRATAPRSAVRTAC